MTSLLLFSESLKCSPDNYYLTVMFHSIIHLNIPFCSLKSILSVKSHTNPLN